jgi:DNA-binding transcriptional ArsR family regulator
MTGIAFVVASRIQDRRARRIRYRNYDHEYLVALLLSAPQNAGGEKRQGTCPISILERSRCRHGAPALGEADFLYLQGECGLTQGNLSSHLLKLEEAAYVEIEKKFKGKRPLTLCRLTPKGEAALSGYSRRLVRALQANQNPKGHSRHS